MTETPQLRTERLLLREWREADRAPFAAMNADPEVMRHFPAILTREQSDAMVDRITEAFIANGFGLWAVEVMDTRQFIGFVGLNRVPNDLPVKSAGFEIGWRLARDAWGHGYATEAAHAVAGFAFSDAGLPELVSFTAVDNQPSQRVMRRIGMVLDGEFDHPAIPAGHRLRRHVLYRLAVADYCGVDGSA